jgi:uncharacterized protein
VSWETKARPVKASTDEAGRFTALVSVFGNVDLEGDMVMPGAFKRTLEERGLPPIFYSHQWWDGPIGATEKAEETEGGLVIEGRLFLDLAEKARTVHASMAAGQLREFSFAYEVVESKSETRDGQDVRLLEELELYEVGPTLVGMNPATELIDVRSGLRLPRAAAPEHEEASTDEEEGAAIRLRTRGLLLARPR